ncbi:ABC transporter ATP-binding protein [Nocardioides sp. GXZ039]|uniref:ABC transporter ATP-binding protein n=1 Tax=Nocardioides sp. GXZ039 TaxID=3136018 RepID=UPI0030F3B26A
MTKTSMEQIAQPAIAQPAVKVLGLSRRFGDTEILKGLDLTIQRDEFVALLGRSGSGKSTLLRALAGLDWDVKGHGEVVVPDSVSVVFQDSRLLPWMNVMNNVTFGLNGRALGRSRSANRSAAELALEEVELGHRKNAWPRELSGGEQQRVALARSLAREPQLLLADEPFGALDALTRIKMQNLLKRLCERHQPAVLFVTHDVDEAISLADRVIVLDHGVILSEHVVEPNERTPGTPGFSTLRRSLLADLGVE